MSEVKKLSLNDLRSFVDTFSNSDSFLEEYQKISIGTVNALETKKRFILSKTGLNTQGVMNFDMSYIFKCKE